jgi:hypothetical protein
VPERLLDEVIPDQERGESRILGAVRGVEQSLGCPGILAEHSEPEGTSACHDRPRQTAGAG